MVSTESPAISASRVRRDRVLFFVGVTLAVLGTSLSMGSYVHDTHHVPLVGEAFHVFGWLNMSFLIIGLLLFASGITLIALSLRGGLLPDYGLSEETL